MIGYLGEEIVDVKDTPYKDYSLTDWALYFAEWGQCDGAHHKAFAIDQMVRVLSGTSVVIKKASWDNGMFEYRISLAKPSKEYRAFVKKYENNGEYEWDIGIDP